MLNPFQPLWRHARQLWATLTGRAPSLPQPRDFLHDPAASRPHNLDDPFFDPKAQRRVAEVIASSAHKKANEDG